MAGFELFPPRSYVALSDSPLQWARLLALAWLSIALVTAGATYSRLTCWAMLDVLEEDYSRTSQAKGRTEGPLRPLGITEFPRKSALERD